MRKAIFIRLPDDLRDRMSDLAKRNRRTMNAEAVAAIESHLNGPDKLRSLIREVLAEERAA
ncbi:MAG: Arc family DNA-binding protein [Variibacter sp.]